MTGREHGEASRLTVYVDARTGQVLTTQGARRSRAPATATGRAASPSRRRGSGSSFSMTNSNASTLKCQNAAGNATFTGTDDVWGNGSRDRPRDRLRRRVLLGREDAPDDVDVAGPQRHERLRRLGADPGRPQRRQRLLRRHPGPDRPHPDRRQVDRLDGRGRRTSSATASTTTRRAASRAAAPRSSWRDTFGAATEWFANNPADAPDFPSARRSTWSARARSATCTTRRPVGDPNCYSSSIPSTEVHAAAGPGNHWFYLLAEGTNPTNGQPTSPTCNGSTVTGVGIQKAAADHVQRDADEDHRRRRT